MDYRFINIIDEIPDNSHFKLHSHECYELMLFLRGDVEYIVEGSTYKLEPYDLVIARPHEMHKVNHLSKSAYSRFILSVEKSFFKKYCPKYEDFFKKHEFGTYNKINSDFVKESGLYDAYIRLKKYTHNFKEKDGEIITAIIVEIMYILSSSTDIYEYSNQETLIHSIITYINRNYKEKISLDDLANENYVSKFYLCRYFKSKTGYTIVGYINHKRLLKVKDLCRAGMNISNASIESGFSNYSAFYKAYIKEYGVSPKNNILN